jgi:signal transduction histidine kinase/AraC-like DNA-binding protein
MSQQPSFRLDHLVERLVNKAGDTEEQLRSNKAFLISALGIVLLVIVLTIYTWVSELPVLTTYGLGLIVFYAFSITTFLSIKKGYQWFFFANQLFIILFTFFTILRLGGIPYSGGLIFVGLGVVVFSMSLPHKNLAYWSFGLYVVTTILEALLHPRLTPAPEMTPSVNVTFFVINSLWITLFMLMIVFYVFSQRTELEKAKATRLQQMDDLKTRLFANIAHEFRTPLTLIRGMAEIIHDDHQHRQQSEVILHNSNKVLRLVDQMLHLARLEAGSMPLRYIQSDIAAFLYYIVSSFQGLAAYRQIKLHFLPDNQVLIVDFDPEKLEDLVGNLISNALKYTPVGGDVYVSINKINTLQKGRSDGQEQLLIKVRDTGIGIPEDKLALIFERFYRIDDTAIHYEEGSGIGLNLVREYVKLLGGDITVHSEPGKGSEFVLTLPVTRHAAFQKDVTVSKQTFEAEIAPFHRDKAESDDTSHPQLLVIEDNPEVTDYLRLLLEKKYKLRFAPNGETGISMALEYIPDLILSDVMMPGKDGYEVCATLKKDFRTSHIPIVLLTARADMDSRLRGLEHGADAYLTKPFNKKELLICLNNLFIIREKLRIKYSSIPTNYEHEATDGLDGLFLKKVYDILEINYQQETFGIEALYEALHISRVQLHRKLMALTGLSASHFIRAYRLEKAREMMFQTSKSISEIAYEVGFSDANYFTKTFTQEYGITPSNIRKKGNVPQ